MIIYTVEIHLSVQEGQCRYSKCKGRTTVMEKKLKVGVIGATGYVGQRLVSLLENHPWFEVTTIAASPRSAGVTYEKAVEECIREGIKNPCPFFYAKKPILTVGFLLIDHTALTFYYYGIPNIYPLSDPF